MKTMTMRRRHALALPLAAVLASCTKPKTAIVGTQIPVLPVTNALAVAADAPAVVLPAPVPVLDWPQSLGGPAHAPGNVTGPVILKQSWQAGIGASGAYGRPLQASPVAAGGTVFAMDANAVVSAYNGANGSQLWRTNTRPKHASEQNLGGGIAVDSGIVYASTGYGELLALDAGTGKINWRQTLDFPTRTPPTVAGGLVALVVQNDLLLTFDAATGTPGWRFTGQVSPVTTSVAITGAPAYADGILVAGFSSGTLAALDANSGTPLWEQSFASAFGQASALDFSDIVAAPVINGGVVYAIGLGNTAMAVDLHSGAKVWVNAVKGTQPFCAAGGFVFLLDADQVLWAIHADDGLVSWSTPLPAFHNMKKKKKPQNWVGPLLLNTQLALTNDYGQIAFVNALTGELEDIGPVKGYADMPPITANGGVLVLTRNAALTFYS
jgi:outer membrane protein assembly factor BamB